jgi:hypothetical protein
LDPSDTAKLQVSVFSRPFGTFTVPDKNPALKRRAISGYPSGICCRSLGNLAAKARSLRVVTAKKFKLPNKTTHFGPKTNLVARCASYINKMCIASDDEPMQIP